MSAPPEPMTASVAQVVPGTTRHRIREVFLLQYLAVADRDDFCDAHPAEHIWNRSQTPIGQSGRLGVRWAA